MLTKEDIATAKEIAAVLRDSKVNELTVAGQLITVLLAEREQQRTAAVGEDTRRAWDELTDEEIRDAIKHSEKVTTDHAGWVAEQRLIWGRAIEAKLKEKNT